MSGIEMKFDADNALGFLRRAKTGLPRILRRELRNMARDAALLARAHAPANMDRKEIKWGLKGLLTFVDAKGGPAAYDSGKGAIPGGPRGSTFSHPVFASKNIPRSKWRWSDTQTTKPFIHKAVDEVMVDAPLLLEAAFQEYLDAESEA